MGKIKICQNPTSKWLRDKFHATPIAIPETRYKPGTLLLYDGDETTFLGELHQLYNSGAAPTLNVKVSNMSDASTERTTKMDIDVGLKILDGFFKSLNMDSVSLSTAFNRVKEISLSFTDVKRNYLDPAELVLALNNNVIDNNHPILKLVDKKKQLLIITDAITSNGFSINDHTSAAGSLNIDLPLIEKYIADANLDVSFSNDKKNSVSLSDGTPRSFAFSCGKLEVDPATATLSIVKLFSPKAVDGEVSPEQEELAYKALMDDDNFEPAMLDIS